MSLCYFSQRVIAVGRPFVHMCTKSLTCWPADRPHRKVICFFHRDPNPWSTPVCKLVSAWWRKLGLVAFNTDAVILFVKAVIHPVTEGIITISNIHVTLNQNMETSCCYCGHTDSQRSLYWHEFNYCLDGVLNVKWNPTFVIV